MSKRSDAFRAIGIINTHDLLTKFATAHKDDLVVVFRGTEPGRALRPARTMVWSPYYKTDRKAHWSDNECKTFPGSRDKTFARGVAWAAERMKIQPADMEPNPIDPRMSVVHKDVRARALAALAVRPPSPTTVAQCKSCPWRVDCEPMADIPGGYSVKLHDNLRHTIKSGIESIPQSSCMHVMACHYSKPGEEFPCAGWLHNQLGPGNNIGVRLGVSRGQLPVPEVDGAQHETFEDTLPKRKRARR